MAFDRKAYMKEYHKKHYYANREKYVGQASLWNTQNPEKRKKTLERQKEKDRERKRKAIEYFGGRCMDCGNEFPDYVYDFHHIDPKEKEFNPAQILKCSWERAVEELKKCVMICSNCHRVRHYRASYET